MVPNLSETTKVSLLEAKLTTDTHKGFPSTAGIVNVKSFVIVGPISQEDVVKL